MYYKLSALELEILSKERNTILKELRESQSTRSQRLKPPILVVPFDSSDLICFIRRDEGTPPSSSTATSRGGSCSQSGDLGTRQKFQRQLQRFGSFVRRRIGQPDPVDRRARRHQRRLATGTATDLAWPGLAGAVLGATGPLMASGAGPALSDPHLAEIGPLMTLKCDVCVLSEYNQVFRLVDAILGANVWPLEATPADRQQMECESINHIETTNS